MVKGAGDPGPPPRMELEDQARGLRWIRRSRARLQTDAMPRSGDGWTQPRLFECMTDGTEIPDDRAERFERARRVLEETERRTGVKRPPAGTQEPAEEDGEG